MSRTWLPPSFLRLAEVLPETPQGCRATRLADVLGQDAGNAADEEQFHGAVDMGSKLTSICLDQTERW